MAAAEVADRLAGPDVNAPAGSFYALEASRWLGLGDGGGVRAGIAPYTTAERGRPAAGRGAARSPVRRAAASVAAALVRAGCSPRRRAGVYTDAGDACRQAVSAIGYADDLLKPLGQEPFQDFDDATRSRLAAVAGTLALEARDWPSSEVAEQAQVLQPLAQAAGEKEGGRPRARAARVPVGGDPAGAAVPTRARS